MTADDNQLAIDVELLIQGKEVVTALADLLPERSLSFTLNDDGLRALSEVLKVSEWGMGANMPKLREAALELLSPLVEEAAGAPLNVNLTEYELKAMTEVIAVIDRAIKNQKDGVWKR